MALEYLWCYQVEKESYLSKLVERNKDINSLKVALFLFLHLNFDRLDFSAESGKVMSKKTEFVS